jgi:hypothetical protein
LRPPLLHKREVLCEINLFEVCEAEDEVTKGEETYNILGLIDGGIFGGSFGGLFFIIVVVVAHSMSGNQTTATTAPYGKKEGPTPGTSEIEGAECDGSPPEKSSRSTVMSKSAHTNFAVIGCFRVIVDFRPQRC